MTIVRNEGNSPAIPGRVLAGNTGKRGMNKTHDTGDDVGAGDRVRIERVVSTLAEWLDQARQRMKDSEKRGGDGPHMADMARMGVILARVSDALVRALLAQARLAAQPAPDSRTAHLSAELERVLSELGLGEESGTGKQGREHTQKEGESR